MDGIWLLVDEGLGNTSYLVDLGDGTALAVDPSRDPRPYRELAARHGLTVAFAAETHVHADFVSGGRELAGMGATLVAPAAAGLAFPHHGVADEDEVAVGDLHLRVLATPGHSPEHVAYVLMDGATELAAFTGGALIVGGVARTDLAGSGRTEELARTAYRSAQDRLFTLPDTLSVYPTHGPGSFCSAGGAGERTSTIGREKSGNPLLAGADEQAFVDRLLAGLGSYPAYFSWLSAVNRRGAPRYGLARPPLAALTPAHVRELAQAGAVLVDARPIEAFAAGHVPRALSIAWRPVFATWLGWLVDPDRPLVFVLDAEQDRDALVEACLKVGYEHLVGELDGGVPAWREAGLPTERTPLVGPDGLTGRRVLDVRQDREWREGHIPGAIHHELGELTALDAGAELREAPATVMCAHGERSMTGASLLAARGADDLTVLRSGAEDWSAVTGEPLAREP